MYPGTANESAVENSVLCVSECVCACVHVCLCVTNDSRVENLVLCVSVCTLHTHIVFLFRLRALLS